MIGLAAAALPAPAQAGREPLRRLINATEEPGKAMDIEQSAVPYDRPEFDRLGASGTISSRLQRRVSKTQGRPSRPPSCCHC